LQGGLGIRDLPLVNLSLLAKWRWKLLMDGDEVWKRIIVAKYGEHALIFGWVIYLLNNGIWVSGISLEQQYPRLFNISVQHDAMIRDMGRWDGGVWRWNLLWRRRFFA
jgi:hypothetical protein